MTTGLAHMIDLTEILFTLFWLFFIGLIIYIRREDKREGYPLESDRSDKVKVQGFPGIPEPKTYLLAHGGTQMSPREEGPGYDLAAEPAAPHFGAPLLPTGDAMADGLGSGAYALRSDTPDLDLEGNPRVVPMRVAGDFSVDARDLDLRGLPVLGAEGDEAGKVVDLWVDRVEPQIYFVEIELAEGGGRRLMPFHYANLDKRNKRVKVEALYAPQFAKVPQLKDADTVTLLEEDKITAFFAGGILYADPRRQEPYF